MKKSMILVAALGMMALTSCEKETELKESELPEEIKAYVATHFAESTVEHAWKEKDDFTTTYEVQLSGNVQLEFDEKKRIEEIEALTALPASVIPGQIEAYVKSHYPDNFIIAWELDGKIQQIKLDHGLELVFDKNGNFLRID